MFWRTDVYDISIIQQTDISSDGKQGNVILIFRQTDISTDRHLGGLHQIFSVSVRNTVAVFPRLPVQDPPKLAAYLYGIWARTPGMTTPNLSNFQ